MQVNIFIPYRVAGKALITPALLSLTQMAHRM